MAENSIKPLKICYFSTHSILEFEELKLFGEIGWDYLSLGAYFSPLGDESSDVKRPPLPAEHNLWSSLKDLGGGNWDKDHLKAEQLEPFDVIVIMHNPVADQPWINNNWNILKHKKVVWRSIGQSSRTVEKSLEKARSDGLK